MCCVGVGVGVQDAQRGRRSGSKLNIQNVDSVLLPTGLLKNARILFVKNIETHDKMLEVVDE
jgi:hypothetical protein